VGYHFVSENIEDGNVRVIFCEILRESSRHIYQECETRHIKETCTQIFGYRRWTWRQRTWNLEQGSCQSNSKKRVLFQNLPNSKF